MENRRFTPTRSFDRSRPNATRTRPAAGNGSSDNRGNRAPNTSETHERNGGRRPANGDGRGSFQARKGPGKFSKERPGFFQKNGTHHASKNKFQAKGKTARGWDKTPHIKLTSDLQVSDGKHRGKLMTNTISVRHVPTARRMREIVFKILTRQIRGKRFLDLCAGCGMVGLDAVSRGAMIATFVDRSARMCDLIKKNLEFCGVREGHGEIIEAEVVPFLKKMSKRKRFWDVIYFGAPDNTDHETALEYFGRGAVIARGGLLLIEHHKELFFPEKLGILKRSRVVVVDDKAISFYERK
jgi:16S rRNA (guanine(966)-N(2))-methyltransferase RsmD